MHLYVNIPGSAPYFDTVSAALKSLENVETAHGIQNMQRQEPEKTYPAPFSPVPPAVIHIGPGIYREKLVISRPNLTLQGEGSDRTDTVLVWGDAAFDPMPEGDRRGTFRTASVRIDTHDFTARHLTFQNDAGYGHAVGQALALYVDGDRICFEDCCLLGSQDTLFTAPLPLKEAIPGGFKGPGADKPRIPGRHCFQNCLIRGDVDFIFGGGTAWFENCVLFSGLPREPKTLPEPKHLPEPKTLPEQKTSLQAHPSCIKADDKAHQNPDAAEAAPVYGYVTAASTPKDRSFGYVFHNCRLESDCPPGTVMLGRPWREWAKTVYLDCELGAHIHPAGWADWGKPHGHFFFAEYRSKGPGASPDTRADFSRQLTEEEAAEYTMENVLEGWVPDREQSTE